ncbi:hypothetical protein BDV06DRAFT_217105 [Aspergillus oleicola]
MDSLPIELIEVIISFVPQTSLRTFSSVGYTQAQLEGLLQISRSSYTSNIRALCYEANALVNPYRRCFETSKGLLLLSLPNLPNLQTIEINLTNGLKDQFGHASGYMPPGQDSYLNHLEKLLTAAAVARENEIIIRAFYISGFYHQAAIEDCFLQALALKALSSIKEIRVILTSPILPFIERIPLLRLQRVELIDIWLSLGTLEGLLRKAQELRSLYMEDIWLIDELVSCGGEFGLSKGLVVSIVGVLERLGRPLDVILKYCEKTCHFAS